jgi:TatD DNase family protein
MIFDTHCHLYDEKFTEGGEKAIQTCLENGVSLMMIPGDNIENSKKAIELANLFDEVYCAVGIHPEEVDSISLEEGINELRILSKNKKVKAIGEIGLDRYWIKDEEVINKQVKYFIAQIELANELGLPVIIHDREAHGLTLDILKEHTPKFGGVLHCFSGSVEYMHEIIKLGLYIGLDGPVTWKNAVQPKEIAKNVPLDRLVVETDSPYMTPAPNRGKTNYPYYVKYVIEEIGKITEKVSREIEEITYENGRKLFRI